MAREHSIVIHRLQEAPIPGRENKFVITDTEVWFLPLEEGETEPPLLAEVLLAVFGDQLDDEAFVEELDARLEDGRMLLGYVLKCGNVEVHSLMDAPSPAVRARLREVFGREVEGIGDPPIGGSARPGAEDTR